MAANQAFLTALLTACTVTGLFGGDPVLAQSTSITSAIDDVGTTVQVDGNRYDISGGRLSGDRLNLFQSFEKFGLSQNEVANFLADPTVQNILGRVIGGDPSVIDGLLQISGSEANLFLINPAGVLLGPNVSLNLPAAFTVTTANGVGFGGNWFNAFGPNDYAQLVGSPDTFAFTTAQPGAITNAGNLTLNPGQHLMLLGGEVISTGSLIAPGGEITVAAIPGQHLVRISHDGLLLNLELETIDRTSALPSSNNFTPISIPTLLTGRSTLTHATNIVVNPDNSIRLTGSDLKIPMAQGYTVISGVVDTANPLSSDGIGGSVRLLGQTVGLINATVDASGANDGGQIFVGGAYKGEGTLPNANITYVDPKSSLRADALTAGNGGQVIVWSELTSRVYGDISVRGGMNFGGGGFVETSSRGYLDVRGAPDTGAPSGHGGVWLIDPRNIFITGASSFGFGSPFESPFTAQLDDANLSILDLQRALDDGDVVISTGSTGGQAGNIVLQTDLNYNGLGKNNLTLQAAGDILIEANIFDSGSDGIPPTGENSLSLTLQADTDNNGDGSVVFGNGTSTIVIDTFGGNILAQGNTENETGAAILVRANTSLDVGDGDISFTGIGGDGPGIEIETANATVKSDTGDITFNGSSQNNTGILINGDVLSFMGGAITLSGSSNSRTSFGLHLNSNGNVFTSGALMLSGSNTAGVGLRAEQGIGSFGGSITLEGNSGNGSLGIDIAENISSGGGRIELTSDNDIQVGGISAEVIESSGPGGEIVVSTAGFFRVTGTVFTNNETDASIATSGAPITITHGGNGQTPFVVGNASVNGTAGKITNDTNTILPAPSEPSSFLIDFVLGDISILTTPPVPPKEVDCLIGCGFDNDDPTPPEEEDPSNPPLTITPTSADEGAFQSWQMEDTSFTGEFAEYLGLEDVPDKDFADVQGDLLQVANATGIPPALIYVVFTPSSTAPEAISLAHPKAQARQQAQTNPSQDSDQLELILATPSGPPIRKRVEGVTRAEAQEMANQLSSAVTLSRRRRTTRYLKPAQQFYDWLIAPLEAELAEEDIQHLSFVMDAGLRSLPVSVLHDGQDFIIENYSLGIIPSLNLTDTRYVDIRNAQVLAMGASEFENLPALPSVPLELNIISQTLWEGREFVNESFTPETLIKIRREFPYGIVHLATHGEFRSGKLENSFIQFWDQRLQLNQIRQLGLNDPPLELLVLSACRMALGDQQAELGFAGLAVQAGVRTALASLWQVSDLGSASLMTEFYHQLRTTPIKAEALRQAQLAMLRGETTVQDNRLYWTGGEIELPPEIAQLAPDSLAHPYFWGAFTLIGSPW